MSTPLSDFEHRESEGADVVRDLSDFFGPNATKSNWLSGNYDAPEETISDRERYQNIALSQLAREYSDPEELYRQWEAVKDLWGRESGWNPTAQNPTSSAYGIPQAMLSLDTGNPRAEHYGINNPEWKADPIAQIRWGLQYIRGRYGSPANALAFWLKHGHY